MYKSSEPNEVRWFVSELHNIPPDGVSNMAADLNANGLRTSNHGSRSLIPTSQGSTPGSVLAPTIETISAQVEISKGRIAITLILTRNSRTGRLFFLPERGSTLSGLVIHCRRDLTIAPHLPRTLSTFKCHPGNAPVFSALRNGDLAAMQEILSSRLVLPNDRDEDGKSLLHVSRTRLKIH